ncbi:uncharacterized protein LY79DRAFT_704315 [Colletotrichum navitas]|uniref:Uncharacterized protein n=1 Tax=Colletotrichum navitas TaxID=681940 RepID=A0AAD8V3P3_9PEZI|nr:uncharacterized protein LY79DRAFT_704315 [Colletotrichum navitas]KAK1586103.1 hypothetical protein LY79DRAFT_704315 [Colletotrichum navitas]
MSAPSGTTFMRETHYEYPDALLQCRKSTDGPIYKINAHEYSCGYFAICSCPKMKPEPDTAGKGLIFNVAISGYSDLHCDGLHHPLPGHTFCLVVGRTNEARQSCNPIDRFARKHVAEPTRRLMFRLGTNPDLQSLVAYDLVNTVSDLQLVTGLAVLVWRDQRCRRWQHIDVPLPDRHRPRVVLHARPPALARRHP